jgi:hypothetical protein
MRFAVAVSKSSTIAIEAYGSAEREAKIVAAIATIWQVISGRSRNI